MSRLKVPHPAGALITQRHVAFPPDHTWRSGCVLCGFELLGLPSEVEAVRAFIAHACKPGTMRAPLDGLCCSGRADGWPHSSDCPEANA